MAPTRSGGGCRQRHRVVKDPASASRQGDNINLANNIKNKVIELVGAIGHEDDIQPSARSSLLKCRKFCTKSADGRFQGHDLE